ncbi:hypothetical protein PybrP1_013013 [[Pythium] brassicae (nom. inval.)]|nr:hypothetical protein PybrP1_013013 [[Pythium] brassicae (nom. inval.)]
MEEFFQYIGPASATSTSTHHAPPLAREKLFLYAAPRENPIERIGEVPAGAYFASAGLIVHGTECWLKIRRGVFSNAKLNGYVRVEIANDDDDADDGGEALLPPHQCTSIADARPTRFKRLRRLPSFPAFLCARERLLVSRIPVFDARERKKSFSSDDAPPASSSSSSSAAAHVRQRFLPPVSVFHATECQFNDDFSQLALKVTSTFGMTGWVSASFHATLIEVEDPRSSEWTHPVYVQNVAPKTGKLLGELPVRAEPSLQAPKVGSLASFRIVEAVERKLVKDQVWLRIRHCSSSEKPAAAAPGGGEGDSHSLEDARATTAGADPVAPADSHAAVATGAWVVERNVNTGERVVIPWGAGRFRPELPNSDRDERYYRNVYSRRPLPLRRGPELSSEIVGQVDPGAVFASSLRVLNEQGRMWVRVPLAPESAENPQDAKQFGYAIQSNTKTNRCMLQEIPAPGKMAPPQFFQVAATRLTARAAPSVASNELFAVRDGAVVRALGTLFVRAERRVWLQVLAAELDSPVRVRLDNVVLSADEQQQNVVYVPVCAPTSPTDAALRRIHVRQIERVAHPSAAASNEPKHAARVVFSGRASKLFGSQLMQPSTIDLPALGKPTMTKKTEATGAEQRSSPAAAAAGETQSDAQTLKDEITRWQRESERLSALSGLVARGAAQLGECLKRPFGSCLATSEARQKYAQLYQQDDDEDGLEFGELRV